MLPQEDIKKNQFVAEYTGELINHREADRRGKAYDRDSNTYLFDLNDDWVIDAKHKGNKMRFANHRSVSDTRLFLQLSAIQVLPWLACLLTQSLTASSMHSLQNKAGLLDAQVFQVCTVSPDSDAFPSDSTLHAQGRQPVDTDLLALRHTNQLVTLFHAKVTCDWTTVCLQRSAKLSSANQDGGWRSQSCHLCCPGHFDRRRAVV